MSQIHSSLNGSIEQRSKSTVSIQWMEGPCQIQQTLPIVQSKAGERPRPARTSLSPRIFLGPFVCACVCLYVCLCVCLCVCVFFHVLTISFRFSLQPSKSPSHFFVVVHARMPPSSFLQTLSQLFKSFRFLNNIRQSVSQSGS